MLEAAKAVCLAAEGTGRNKNFKVGAILFKKNHIYAARSNSYKTHPHILLYSNYPYLHAESACILSHGLDNCYGMDLMVTRMLRNKQLCMAKPCEACMSLIKDVGISNVYFTNWEGDLTHVAL
jgi:tRNA(Arg) A34 adenosine deaminase TadA